MNIFDVGNKKALLKDKIFNSAFVVENRNDWDQTDVFTISPGSKRPDS